ncbi:TIGR02679 domain-containing protein [Nocardia sp. FBN12]|uniref:TIGR02679 domain-containing protein n=1 Tax=Nocardia sp. FBN12 TaxID=3419766 RepID=UPI003D082D73
MAARSLDRRELWEWLGAHSVVAAQPVRAGWVAAMERAGLVEQSIPRTRTLLESALRVLGAIPAQGQPLPVFADETVDDPHALDDGTRLQAMVIRALAVIHDRPVPTDAGELRRLWALAGVVLECACRFGHARDPPIPACSADRFGLLAE